MAALFTGLVILFAHVALGYNLSQKGTEEHRIKTAKFAIVLWILVSVPFVGL